MNKDVKKAAPEIFIKSYICQADIAALLVSDVFRSDR